jgi:cytochrome c553
MAHDYMGLHTRLLFAVLASGVLRVAQAAQPTPDPSRLYAPCVVCHQLNAWGTSDGNIPNLAGQQKHYLEKQLARFRSGARVDTAMQVVAIHPTISNQSTDLVALATYLSRLDTNPHPLAGSGEHLQAGLETYTHICAACHGADGRGGEGSSVPRLTGQHYPYLRRQIEAAAELHKELSPPEMTSALRGMPAPAKDALADYISRLGTSEALLGGSSTDRESLRYIR